VLRDGTILPADLPPVPAAGRTLRDLRAELESRVARDMPGTELFLPIGQLRQMAVFVRGEVQRPGMQTLTALGSVLDALQQAGGVRTSGSLRAIRIEGPQGTRVLDLYTVIAGEAGSGDIRLREGERILVPALGTVVAIAGEVTRPAIYELPAGAQTAPPATLLRLAGDPLRPAGNRFLLQGTDASGRRFFNEIQPGDAVRRGDSVLVQPGADVIANQLRLAGHVAAPVTRAAGRGTTLRGLLSDARLLRPDPYVRMGVVLRLDATTRVRRALPFDLAQVMAGRANLSLADGDEVLVLGQADIAFLASPPVQRALRGEAPSEGTCPALTMLAIAAPAAPARFAHARGAGFPDIGAPACPPIFQEHPQLLPFLLDAAVLLTGEVKQPGLFPVLDNTGLDLLLAAAGGATEGADLSAVELAREPTQQAEAIALTRQELDLRSRDARAVRLSPRDVVRIPRSFTDREVGPVTLGGEVIRPGVYDLRRGERLSDLLARAGGLTPQAYAYGAIFTRESVRIRQQDGFARTARDIEISLLSVAAGQANVAPAGQRGDVAGLVAAGRELAATLGQAQAAGRMVVEANPVVLAARLELDVLLESGDLIVIPKRPNEVTVVGSVLNPGSLQFQSGLARGGLRARSRRHAALRRSRTHLRRAAQRANRTGGDWGLAGWRAAGAARQPGGGAAGSLVLRDTRADPRRDGDPESGDGLGRRAGGDRARAAIRRDGRHATRGWVQRISVLSSSGVAAMRRARSQAESAGSALSTQSGTASIMPSVKGSASSSAGSDTAAKASVSPTPTSVCGHSNRAASAQAMPRSARFCGAQPVRRPKGRVARNIVLFSVESGSNSCMNTISAAAPFAKAARPP
jgi:protein involved in polysaccharide export with SLBB domain